MKGLGMNRLQTTIPFLYHVYMMIAEPRVRRLMYFGIYFCLALAGAGTFLKPPKYLADTLGGYLWIYIFASFIVIGSMLALIAVLPGIWWLERSALIAIITGVVLYTLTLLFFGATFLVMLLPIIVILICALRLLDIKEFLLAPREG